LTALLARFGAVRPEAILVHQTIDRALLSIASVSFCVDATAFSAPHWVNDNISGPPVVASAASLGTLRECGPVRHAAINWAWLLVAIGNLVSHGAPAAMKGLAGDFAVTLLRANATGLGAFAPVIPGGNVAVVGAETQVALFGFGECGAVHTTQLREGFDGTVSEPVTRFATADSAFQPAAEESCLAVHRASVSVATFGLIERRACFSAEGSSNIDTA